MFAKCEWTEDQVRSLQKCLGVWDKAKHPKLEHQTWVTLVNELDLVPAKKAWRVRLVESHNESVKLDDHIEICSRLL